jgi:hypothetical protein
VKPEAADDHRIQRGFQLVLQRLPSRSEMAGARALLADQRTRAMAEGSRDAAGAALQSFCRGLLNLNEMIYAD